MALEGEAVSPPTETPAPAEVNKEEPQKETTPDPVALARAEAAEYKKIAERALKESEDAKSYVANLTANLQQVAERQAARDAGGTAETPDIRQRMEEDPLSVMEEHYAARTRPLVAAVTEGQARISRELAINKLKQIKLPDEKTSVWDKYGKEIDEFMEPFGTDAKARPDSYEAAAEWVRAKHLQEEIQMARQADIEAQKRMFVEAPSSGGNAGGQVKKVLSDLEKEVARGLEMSEEDYATWKQGAPS
jgi:hypothetical protein